LEVPRDRELIHSLPRDFIVDGQRGVSRPIGMAGQRLEVETHVVTGSTNSLNNVVQCIERADLQVDALVLEPFATAEAVATVDEREMGVVLIDIGGGTSDIAVFVNGSIVFSSVISVGGNHVTRDIAIGLRTPFEIAERLKIERGAASPALIPHGEALEVIMAGSGERLRIPRALLGEIIEARMSELFEMARDALHAAGIVGRLPGGVILSGGGALLPGAVELGQAIFKMPVRLGYPIGVLGWTEEVDNPQFATGVGLCRFVLKQRHAALLPSAIPSLTSSAGRRVWGALHANGQKPPAPEPVAAQIAEAVPEVVAPVATYAAVEEPVSVAAPVPEPEPEPEYEPAPEAASSTSPFDRYTLDHAEEGRFMRREELLSGVDEEPWWRRLVNKIRQFIGFENS
jgi:cell division protein FtsA